MAALHTAFESFRSAAADLAVAPAIQLFLPGADAAIQAIEKIVLRETDDVEAAMRCLASSVNELQSLLNKSDSSAQAL